MLIDDIYSNAKNNFEEILSEFKKFITEVRGANISTSLLENIQIDYFGQNLPLKQLGTIGVLSPREIEVTLWDETYLQNVIKAIESRNLGLGIKIEKNKIFLSLPPLNEEVRKNLLKLVKERAQKYYQDMRRERDEILKDVQQKEKEGKIREDEKFKTKEKIDKLFQEYNKKMEDLIEAKEKELSS